VRHPATQEELLAFGALSLFVAISLIAFPRLGDAGARFRYRLLHRHGEREEAAVRRDRMLRKVLATAFLVTGVVFLVEGLSR
jgi:hypothetical protein